MAAETAALSLLKTPLAQVEADGKSAWVVFEGIRFEAARRMLVEVTGNDVEFKSCSFVNAGLHAAEVYGQGVVFSDCVFEGAGGSAVQMSDDRDKDTDGPAFALLESRNTIVDSLISDYGSTCRHYCEGVHHGGFGTIIANNHFRASNMPGIDLVGGGAKILHNVFSHLGDGGYDTGAIHWVAASPMERGTEVAYNVFFRNSVSTELCNAATSCMAADVYIDDMAGAMTIHGNVFYKDKVLQPKPPSGAFAPVWWMAILVNGGADVNVYENAFVGPPDGDSPGIYKSKSPLFVQSSGGTLWPDSARCGHTGYCPNDDFYKTMRLYGYDKPPWTNAFPELAGYDATPDTGSNWYCANRRSCPMASWNNTVVCNAGLGGGRSLSHRAMWPSDDFWDNYGVEGKTTPARSEALVEFGNWKNEAGWAETESDADAAEAAGMAAVSSADTASLLILLPYQRLPLPPLLASRAIHPFHRMLDMHSFHRVASSLSSQNSSLMPPRWAPMQVLELAAKAASAAEALPPACNKGTRAAAARSQLTGRGRNPCSAAWSIGGLESCDPCEVEGIQCAPRDMPSDGQCSCGDGSQPKPPTGTPPPVTPSPGPTPPSVTPPSNDEYDQLEGVGYCVSDDEIEVVAGDAPSCREACQAKGYDYMELDGDKTCYCQKDCPCMDDIEDNGRITMVPSGFNVPNQCGDDDGGDDKESFDSYTGVGCASFVIPFGIAAGGCWLLSL